MDKALTITKQTYLKDKGAYKMFSVRVKECTVDALDRLCKEANRPRNEIINMILEFGIANAQVADEQH